MHAKSDHMHKDQVDFDWLKTDKKNEIVKNNWLISDDFF